MAKTATRARFHERPRPDGDDWRLGLRHIIPLAPLVGALPDDIRAEWEERAAIMEYDAGMSRADAERCAYVDVVCAGPDRRPKT